MRSGLRTASFRGRALALRRLDAQRSHRKMASWHLSDKPPKGFGNFYPKNGSGSHSSKKSSNSSSNQQASNGGPNHSNNSNPGDPLGPRIASTLAALGLLGVWLSSRETGSTEINWQEFATVLLESGEVDRIIVTNNKVAEVVLRPGASGRQPQQKPEIAHEKTDTFDEDDDDVAHKSDKSSAPLRYPRMVGNYGQTPSYHFAIGSVEIFERKLEAAQRALGIESRDFIPVQYVNETNWMAEGAKFLPTLLIVGSWLYVMRSMGAGGAGSSGGMSSIFRIGRSNAKKINKEDVKVTYADVAGCDEAKKEVMEFVDFLKDPTRFVRLGAKIPRGALLCGPPGTGELRHSRVLSRYKSAPLTS